MIAQIIFFISLFLFFLWGLLSVINDSAHPLEWIAYQPIKGLFYIWNNEVLFCKEYQSYSHKTTFLAMDSGNNFSRQIEFNNLRQFRGIKVLSISELEKIQYKNKVLNQLDNNKLT